MVLQRIDSRRDESGGLTDVYELREAADGTPVQDPEKIEEILDGLRFRRAMELFGPTAQASITGLESGVLQIRARVDHHRCPDLIDL